RNSPTCPPGRLGFGVAAWYRPPVPPSRSYSCAVMASFPAGSYVVPRDPHGVRMQLAKAWLSVGVDLALLVIGSLPVIRIGAAVARPGGGRAAALVGRPGRLTAGNTAAAVLALPFSHGRPARSHLHHRHRPGCRPAAPEPALQRRRRGRPRWGRLRPAADTQGA